MIEGEVGILEIVEAPAPLHRIAVGPAGAGPEGVQVEMEGEAGQRVRRVVLVGDPLGAAEHSGRFIQPGGDVVGDVLLPRGHLRRRIRLHRLLLDRRDQEKEMWSHG